LRRKVRFQRADTLFPEEDRSIKKFKEILPPANPNFGRVEGLKKLKIYSIHGVRDSSRTGSNFRKIIF